MILFILKESFKSITSAKLSFILSLIAGIISIFIVSVVVLLLGFSDSIEDRIKEKITFTAFLPDSLTEEQVEQVKNDISESSFVKGINYIDKQKAEEVFIKQTGEDFRGILEYNPLPASIEIKIKPEFLKDDAILKVEKSLGRIENIDEVVIQKDFIITLLYWLRTIKFYLLVTGILLFLIALYLVFSMNKIIIHNKSRQIETMKLVGARDSTIRLPYIVNGLIIGVCASLFCILFYKVIILLLNFQLKDLFISTVDSIVFITAIIVSGVLLGFFGSLLAVGKISIKVKKINF
ncbi:MAG: FtsX-like permease family protein [Ignavibacteriales bacterium]|nr:MAG: FtsX-like permease family protein [Ignavibacteriales bacterium]